MSHDKGWDGHALYLVPCQIAVRAKDGVTPEEIKAYARGLLKYRAKDTVDFVAGEPEKVSVSEAVGRWREHQGPIEMPGEEPEGKEGNELLIPHFRSALALLRWIKRTVLSYGVEQIEGIELTAMDEIGLCGLSGDYARYEFGDKILGRIVLEGARAVFPQMWGVPVTYLKPEKGAVSKVLLKEGARIKHVPMYTSLTWAEHLGHETLYLQGVFGNTAKGEALGQVEDVSLVLRDKCKRLELRILVDRHNCPDGHAALRNVFNFFGVHHEDEEE